MIQDCFWDCRFPLLPHTKASYPVRDSVPNWRLYKTKIQEQLTCFTDEELDVKQEVELIQRSKSNEELAKEPPAYSGTTSTAITPGTPEEVPLKQIP